MVVPWQNADSEGHNVDEEDHNDDTVRAWNDNTGSVCDQLLLGPQDVYTEIL